MMLNADYDESDSSKEVIFDSSVQSKNLDGEDVPPDFIKNEISQYNGQYLETSLRERFLEIICLVVTPDDFSMSGYPESSVKSKG